VPDKGRRSARISVVPAGTSRTTRRAAVPADASTMFPADGTYGQF